MADRSSDGQVIRKSTGQIANSLLLFLFVLGGILGGSLYFGWKAGQLERQANLVSRLLSHAQSISKSVFEYDIATLRGNVSQDVARSDLVEDYAFLSEGMRVLAEGGTIRQGDRDIRIPQLSDEGLQDIYESAQSIWTEYQDSLLPLQSDEEPSTGEISLATGAANRQGAELLTLLRECHLSLLAEASRLDGLQMAFKTGALLLTPLFLLNFLRTFNQRMRATNEEIERREEMVKKANVELENAKAETDSILYAVNEGLMLVHPDLRIGSQYSAACESLFSQKELAGKNFLDVLQKLVSAKTHETARKYMTLIFKANIEESTLHKFNPFHNMEVNRAGGPAGLETRFLDFQFSRVLEAGEVIDVIVTLQDVTDRVGLEKQLRDSEEAVQRQLEMMFDVVNCDLGSLHEFLDRTESSLLELSNAMKGDQTEVPYIGPEREEEFRKLLDKVFRTVHTIKGNASMVKLKIFETRAHDFEEKIIRAKKEPQLRGNDFLPLILALSEMLGSVSEIRNLLDRISEMRGFLGGRDEPSQRLADGQGAPVSPLAADRPPTKTTGQWKATKPIRLEDSHAHGPATDSAGSDAMRTTGMISGLRDLAQTLGARQGKQVSVDSEAFDESVIPSRFSLRVRDVIIQLVRNAVSHGLESPGERTASGKPSTGVIRLATAHADGTLQVVIHDDGKGLDYDRIRERAVAEGLVNEEELSEWSEVDLIGLIFQPGFSTAIDAHADAGRGVGMDMVQQEIHDMGGYIEVSSLRNSHTEIRLVFPSQQPTPELQAEA